MTKTEILTEQVAAIAAAYVRHAEWEPAHAVAEVMRSLGIKRGVTVGASDYTEIQEKAIRTVRAEK